MSLNVSSWSIRNPSPAILLFVLLTVLGLMAFSALSVQNFPDIDVPRVSVSASLPGASPSQMETEVARKIENSLATVQGVKHIHTTLTDGSAEIAIEFRLEKPTDQAVDDVRDAVARVRADLPADLRDPVIKKVEIVGSAILTFTVAPGSDRQLDTEALSWIIDNDVSRTLLAVPGVGAVNRVGGIEREVRVELDPQRLLALNTTAAEISRQLREVQQEASGGRVDLGGIEQSVRTIATVRTAEDIAAIELSLTDGRRIRIGQVATMTDTAAEARAAALLDGRPVVGFEIVRARGFGELEVAAGVRRAVATL
ncbi:efflux RND transporter permease subunit, partial [Roseateles sp.]|uniref:efflux RND transporter permease subunit n=1 Tax=Roseateles sp. TaxID=1971397 RepID=UPI002F3F9455